MTTPMTSAQLRTLSELGVNTLESEILAEKASSLGHHGRMVEKTMAALKAFDPATGTADERLVLVKAAARATWKFFVQRELCGLRDQREIIRFYGIPQEVLNRLGAIER
jgi:hypothetical protein